MHKYAWHLHMHGTSPGRVRRKVLPTVASEEAAGEPGGDGD